MAYKTAYKLSVEPNQPVPSCECNKPDDAKYCPNCGKQVRRIQVLEFARAACEQLSGESLWNGERSVWYNHEKHLGEISMQPMFQDLVFALKMVGDEHGDYKIKYFKNGKVMRGVATIVYPEFDPAFLRDIEDGG